MGRLARGFGFGVFCSAVALSVQTANAALVLSVTDNATGLASADALPGDTISIDVSVTGTGFDTFQRASFDVGFADPEGDPSLLYNSYAWNAPPMAATGGGDDASDPGNSGLQAAITRALFGDAASDFDVHFDNLTGEEGGTGITFNPTTDHLLVTLSLTVPSDFLDGDADQARTVTVTPLGNVFQLGPFRRTIGDAESFELNVIPEPVTLALLGVGGLVGIMRRRRR